MEFRLLGPVEVLQDGRALPLGGRRQRTVLAHLLLSRNTAVASDVLIEQAWGDNAPCAVRASLHTYVSRLRATLGPSRIETRSTGYVLYARDEEVDATGFEATLRRARALVDRDPDQASAAYDDALNLWSGPALGDLAGESSLTILASHLEALRGQALEERIAARLATGHHVALLPELEDLLQRDGLREDLWAHYVLALYRSGRQGDALAAFARARRILRDELGVEPSDTLRRLHERVLRQDESLTLSGSALHGYRLLEVLGEGSSSVVHRAVQPFVEREVALKVLRRSLADDPRLVQRFATDAQTAANVAHPHVVPLHDFWRSPGGAFLALRLLRGGTLADLTAHGSLELDDLLRLVDQVASALDACHRQGVVHRVLTPRHVLLDEDGNAYVSPFVLARDLDWTMALEPVRAGSAAAPEVVAVARPDVEALRLLLRELCDRVPALPGAVRDLADAPASTCPTAQSLAAQLRARVGVPTSSPPSETTAPPGGARPRNPYKGLLAFSEADAGDFFGQTPLVHRLVERLSEPLRFLAVVGPSGSGKSSVVRAGLIPALRGGALDPARRWYVVDVVPGADPLVELETALRRVAVAPLPHDAVDGFRTDPRSFVRLVDAVLPDDVPGERSEVLLLVDQFEELFTLSADQDSRAFTDLLVEAANASESRVRVVVTLRADFYDRPLERPALGEHLRNGTEVVLPLSPEGLEQAIVDPAEGVGLQVEPALLAQVVADVRDAPGCLPLLQFALTELAERIPGTVLSLAAYQEIGGVSGALVRRANDVYARFTSGQQKIARQVLLALIQPDEPRGVVTRRRVLQTELVQRTGADTAQAVVDALGAARLLEFDRDPVTRAPTVQVAHEALVREWQLLREWAQAARDDLRIAQRLAAAAREWDETERDPSFLATGSRLDAVERWVARGSAVAGWTPTQLERAYISESQRVRTAAQQEAQGRRDRARDLERRALRRLRAVATALAFAVSVASALTLYGFSQRDRAEHESLLATARALAAASVASLEEDPERAVLLALEAVRRTRDEGGWVLPQAEEALHRAVVASRAALTLTGVGGAIDWSAGGLIVSEGPEWSGLIDVRDAETGRSVRSFPGHAVDVNDVAFSPDGRRLLTTGDDGAARLWDPTTGQLVWELRTRGQVRGPSFSGDGRRMAAAWQDEGVARVIDVATGTARAELTVVEEPVATSLDHSGSRVALAGRPVAGAVVHDVASGARVLHLGRDGDPAYDVDFSPDGQWLATSGVDGRARLWTAKEGSPAGTLFSSAPIAELDWSPDSRRAVVGGDDGVARVYSIVAGGTREVLRLSSSQLRGIGGAAFSHDGRRVALGGTPTDVAQVWDVDPTGSREWLTVGVPAVEGVGADFSADGRRVLVSSYDSAVSQVDEAGRTVRITRPYAGGVQLLRTSPDGAVVAGFTEGAVRAWTLATGREVFSVPVRGSPLGLTWSGDGALLGVAVQGEPLRVLDRRGERLPLPQQLGGAPVASVAFSADGGVMVTAQERSGRDASRGSVDVWDRRRGQLVRSWLADARVLAVDDSGDRVATVLADGEVALWDLRTSARLATLVGHVGPVWDLAFSADGRQLATSGQDATVRLWDLASGAERLTLRGHQGVVSTVRFDHTGDRLVTASGDGTVRVWALALDDLVALATERLTRGLSAAECRRYLGGSC